MGISMQHWNGSQMCVVDVETTGLEAGWHEIFQIAVLPLDSNLFPREDVQPFYVNMKPDHPERWEKAARTVTSTDITEIMRTGFDPLVARDLFIDWVDKLGLPCTPSGARKYIIPLGHNYLGFDQGFVKSWLGFEEYNNIFHGHARDTMTFSLLINDGMAYHAEKVPYAKVSLGALCSRLDLKNRKAHDALQDCIATAECYRRMLKRFNAI